MADLERSLLRIAKEIVDAELLNLSGEQSVQVLLSHVYHAPKAMCITFYFPDDVKLTPVSTVGIPPRIGETVFVQTLRRQGSSDPTKDYDSQHEWRVSNVAYVLVVETDPNQLLKDAYQGIESHQYKAEIHLSNDFDGVYGSHE